MPKPIHQGIDTNLGVGELGGERVTQPAHQRPAGSFAVDGGFLEGAQDAVLQGSASNALALCPDEQACVRWRQAASPPAAAERVWAYLMASARGSMPMTRPLGPTRLAAIIAMSPGPQKMSSTVIPSLTLAARNSSSVVGRSTVPWPRFAIEVQSLRVSRS